MIEERERERGRKEDGDGDSSSCETPPCPQHVTSHSSSKLRLTQLPERSLTPLGYIPHRPLSPLSPTSPALLASRSTRR